ncbi:transporter [Rubricoccus marinus]|uniref:Transporter n=1 Tax=Rubricoccus marinus TaxID=716817 RepID=A0A259TUW6_9BACT|nr:transporter [Rubricoccus marinus]
MAPSAPHVDLPPECADVEQVPEDLRDRALAEGNAPLALAVYGLLGAGLGLVFTKSQVISWFRIYEMFRFESFHMYGIIGSAVATAALSVWVIQKLKLTTVHGEPIELAPKAWGDSRVPGARYWMGGITFGLGWALLGACPGPLVALLGGGVSVMAAALVAALGGTWTYALLRDRLPH